MDQAAMSRLTPGATAAVVADQDVLWSHAYGYADMEAGRPATPGTTFSICSISKLFTSVAIMKLVEQGKVDLDAGLGEYLDDFELPAPEGVMADPVTIRALLSHSAGLPREGDGAYWNTRDFPSQQQLEGTLENLGRLYTPFTHYQYSNIGMSLLGKVVAEVSGVGFPAFVEEEIFRPLQLNTMTTDMPRAGEAGDFARGYYEFDPSGKREVVEHYQLKGLAPAGGFTASVIDLSKFASWQFRLLDGGKPEVLRRTTLMNMHKVHWYDPFDPASRVYGLGFSHVKYGETPMIGHGGYCIGQRAEFALDPKNQVAVTAMVNAENTAPSMIAQGIFELTAGAIRAVADAAPDQSTDRLETLEELGVFEGVYRWPRSPMAFYAIPKADGDIELINLYDPSPADGAGVFRRQDGDRFRRVRKDGELGEELVFERDDAGAVRSIYHEGYRYTRSSR
jgi:CubicO group peptidase (beta-lactamase class C family)